jgi:hypothetical protein
MVIYCKFALLSLTSLNHWRVLVRSLFALRIHPTVGLGLTQKQLLTESRIAIITQGWAGPLLLRSDHLQAL